MCTLELGLSRQTVKVAPVAHPAHPVDSGRKYPQKRYHIKWIKIREYIFFNKPLY
jgi:hypothetical protein